MIRLKLFTVLLFFIGFICNGQHPYGPKTGINANNFRGNKNFDVTPGYSAGGFAKYKVLGFLSARAEILYFQQGANILDYSLFGADLGRKKAVVRFHTLQIPVLAEFGLPSLSEAAFQPKLLGGAFYSFVLNAREKHLNVARVSGYEPMEYKGYDDVSNQFENRQFGWVAGLAAQVKMFSKPMELEFRYHHNINRINKRESRNDTNLKRTFDEWGDRLYLGTLSFNVAVTLQYF